MWVDRDGRWKSRRTAKDDGRRLREPRQVVGVELDVDASELDVDLSIDSSSRPAQWVDTKGDTDLERDVVKVGLAQGPVDLACALVSKMSTQAGISDETKIGTDAPMLRHWVAMPGPSSANCLRFSPSAPCVHHPNEREGKAHLTGP